MDGLYFSEYGAVNELPLENEDGNHIFIVGTWCMLEAICQIGN